MPPISLAIVDDYELVVAGLREILRPFSDRVVVEELVADGNLQQPVDIALVDTFAQSEAHRLDIDQLVASEKFGQVVIYSWRTDDELVEFALRRGATGYVFKGVSAERLVSALERVHAGSVVVERAAPADPRPKGDWPGRSLGLSEREAQVLAMLVQGGHNDQIADRLFVSVNTVKTHLRAVYRKLDVPDRTRAVQLAMAHGFSPTEVTDQWISDNATDPANGSVG